MTDVARVRGDVRSRLALQIQRLRVARGWTVAELAQRAGLNPAVLVHLESGQAIDVGIDELWQLANALSVDVSVLVAPSVAH